MSMTKRNALIGLTLFAIALAAAGLYAAEEKANLDVKISVRGMTCSGCASGVKAALEKVPGVTKAEVSLEKNEASVTYEKGKTTPEALVKAVEKAGYKASLQKEAPQGA
jgi:copper chaperone